MTPDSETHLILTHTHKYQAATSAHLPFLLVCLGNQEPHCTLTLQASNPRKGSPSGAAPAALVQPPNQAAKSGEWVSFHHLQCAQHREGMHSSWNLPSVGVMFCSAGIVYTCTHVVMHLHASTTSCDVQCSTQQPTSQHLHQREREQTCSHRLWKAIACSVKKNHASQISVHRSFPNAATQHAYR